MIIQEQHSQAMELAEQADFLKMQGKTDEAVSLYEKSFLRERGCISGKRAADW